MYALMDQSKGMVGIHGSAGIDETQSVIATYVPLAAREGHLAPARDFCASTLECGPVFE